jgi:hypothetical protein
MNLVFERLGFEVGLGWVLFEEWLDLLGVIDEGSSSLNRLDGVKNLVLHKPLSVLRGFLEARGLRSSEVDSVIGSLGLRIREARDFVELKELLRGLLVDCDERFGRGCVKVLWPALSEVYGSL